MIIFVRLTQANPDWNIFQKIITHILSNLFHDNMILSQFFFIPRPWDIFHQKILKKRCKTYDVNKIKAVHSNKFWWNLKQLPRVLKSNYSKRFPKNRPWQSSCSNVLINNASNKNDSSKNGYSVKYQSCIQNFIKHLSWSFFLKIFISS